MGSLRTRLPVAGDTQPTRRPGKSERIWQIDYLFVGGALVFDLVNTEVVVRRRLLDLLQAPADLAAWWEAARSHHPELPPLAPETVDAALLDATKELRAALRRLFSALVDDRLVDPGDLDVLNRVLSGGYPVLELSPGGKARSAWRSREAEPTGALLPIALSALRLATDGDHSRLHRCANGRCVLLFYDTTRSATRRWCSLDCMNRARSASRYRQKKHGAAPPRGADPAARRSVDGPVL